MAENTTSLNQWLDLYETESSALVKFATVLVGAAAADDVVSDAMIRLLDRPIPLDPRPYLYRTVSNTAKNHLRSLGRRQARETVIASYAPPSSEPVFRPEVLAAVAGLSTQQRAVIFLTYWSDLPVAAVADRLGVSSGTVKRQLARARAKLGKQLQP